MVRTQIILESEDVRIYFVSSKFVIYHDLREGFDVYEHLRIAYSDSEKSGHRLIIPSGIDMSDVHMISNSRLSFAKRRKHSYRMHQNRGVFTCLENKWTITLGRKIKQVSYYNGIDGEQVVSLLVAGSEVYTYDSSGTLLSIASNVISNIYDGYVMVRSRTNKNHMVNVCLLEGIGRPSTKKTPIRA